MLSCGSIPESVKLVNRWRDRRQLYVEAVRWANIEAATADNKVERSPALALALEAVCALGPNQDPLEKFEIKLDPNRLIAADEDLQKVADEIIRLTAPSGKLPLSPEWRAIQGQVLTKLKSYVETQQKVQASANAFAAELRERLSGPQAHIQELKGQLTADDRRQADELLRQAEELSRSVSFKRLFQVERNQWVTTGSYWEELRGNIQRHQQAMVSFLHTVKPVTTSHEAPKEVATNLPVAAVSAR